MSREITLLYFLTETLYAFTKEAHQSAKFQIFDRSGEISRNLYFHMVLLLKVNKISAKKVQRSYIS